MNVLVDTLYLSIVFAGLVGFAFSYHYFMDSKGWSLKRKITEFIKKRNPKRAST
jgi:hypothetical protein